MVSYGVDLEQALRGSRGQGLRAMGGFGVMVVKGDGGRWGAELTAPRTPPLGWRQDLGCTCRGDHVRHGAHPHEPAGGHQLP